MRPRAGRPAAFLGCAVAVAALGLLVVYGGQVGTTLFYDDYHFVRPWSPLELRRVWFGSWDPTGIERPFYRPITAYLYAARFWLFGLNAHAMHLLSLVGHGVCALLVGWFLRREGVPRSAALLGVWVYAVHPLFPYAQVSWLTNQMHLAESLVVLAALLAWQSVRDRSLAWWAPLGFLAVVAFLVKEDGIMLLPALVALTALRAWVLGDFRLRRWLPHLLAALAVVVVLVVVRSQRLGRLGGYGVPGLGQAEANWVKGIMASLLLWPTRRPWQAVASMTTIAALAAAVVAARWRRGTRLVATGWILAAAVLAVNLQYIGLPAAYPVVTWQPLAAGAAAIALLVGLGLAVCIPDTRARFLTAAGLTLTVAFDMPFALVTKREQYHLLALGAVLVMTGAALAVSRLPVRRPARAIIAVLVVLLTVPLAGLARRMAADFQPCAPMIAQDDARGWWVVPDEMKSWFDRKQQACRAGEQPPPVSALPVVSWGLYEHETDGAGDAYRWTADRSVLLLRRQTSALTLAVRKPGASGRDPVIVTVSTTDRRIPLVLDSDDWKYTTVRFRPGVLAWLRDGHRVDLAVAPWFVPAVLDPRSDDLRRFGVELRLVELR